MYIYNNYHSANECIIYVNINATLVVLIRRERPMKVGYIGVMKRPTIFVIIITV